MNIIVGGDMMPGGVLYRQERYISDALLNGMQAADVCIATLECAVGDEPVGYVDKPNVVYVREEDLFRVKEMNIGYVSLANNHVFDMGIEGFDRLRVMLDSLGIKYFGAGGNIDEASSPALIMADDRQIALIGCSIDSIPPIRYPRATKSDYGVWCANIKELAARISSFKHLYDAVWVFPHWGKEYQTLPLPLCIDYAKSMIDAGASAVFGSHSHCVQPMINYKTCPICFGMGSLLFPDVLLKPRRCVTYPFLESDITTYAIQYNYPTMVETETIMHWKDKSRCGSMIVINESEGKIDSCKCFGVELDRENILKRMSVLNAIWQDFKLFFARCIMSMPFYATVRSLYYKLAVSI